MLIITRYGRSCSVDNTFRHITWVARGSKGNDFEGGTRVNAFVNGGYLPAERQGKVVDGYMHICDW